MQKQVDRDHYQFASYMHKRRWTSTWHQFDEVLALDPETVLEIGPGSGVFKALLPLFGPVVETLDIDPGLKPDYLGSVFDLPFQDNAYDVVCAFQVLEHLPYEKSLKAFNEMSRVAKKGIVISLPDAKKAWPYLLYLPKIGKIEFFISRPTLRTKEHKFNGEHYWEINKKGYSIKKIIQDFKTFNVRLEKSYRVSGYLQHRFFVFKKVSAKELDNPDSRYFANGSSDLRGREKTMKKIVILIPTIGASKTIDKTLDSLNRCDLPDNYDRLIVVENGPDPWGTSLIKKLRPELNASYLYREEGNKSKALNAALQSVEDGLVVFFDDDIRLHRKSLIAYSEAMFEYGDGQFFAGPFGVDCEELPPDWLLPHLPKSAVGWNLGNDPVRFDDPVALGFNWAAYMGDLRRAGLFNVEKGPGSGARGQETDMQEKLLSLGVTGQYVPQAMVWHYVPAVRCSPDWLLTRALESGRSRYLERGRERKLYALKAPFYFIATLFITGILNFLHLDRSVGFRWRKQREIYRGRFRI